MMILGESRHDTLEGIWEPQTNPSFYQTLPAETLNETTFKHLWKQDYRYSTDYVQAHIERLLRHSIDSEATFWKRAHESVSEERDAEDRQVNT